jgi:hypothetical protein
MPIQSKRLLIVNNDEQKSAALANPASSLGYEVLSTWSGRDSLRSLSEKRIDLLLVDQPNSPSIVLMKNRTCTPIKYDESFGRCQVFEKKQLDDLLRVLRTEILVSTIKSDGFGSFVGLVGSN